MLALNEDFRTLPPSVLGRFGVKALSKFYIPALPGFLINLKHEVWKGQGGCVGIVPQKLLSFIYNLFFVSHEQLFYRPFSELLYKRLQNIIVTLALFEAFQAQSFTFFGYCTDRAEKYLFSW